MKRFKLATIGVLVVVMSFSVTALAGKGPVYTLVPVSEAYPNAAGTVSDLSYYTHTEYGDDGYPIGKARSAAGYFKFTGLQPNTWYNLRGVIIYNGYPLEHWIFSSLAFPTPPGGYVGETFYTDDNGSAEGVGSADGLLASSKYKFAYFKLWTGHYQLDDRSTMQLVLSSQ